MSFRRMLTQLLIGGWLRELFTLGVTADLYAGVPALYVNFVDYDVAAHDLGPRHPEALRALRGIDRSIARFARVLRRIPEHGYDLFVLSDHGQIRSVPFRAVASGVSVAEAIAGCFGPAAGPRRDRCRRPRPPAASRPTGPEGDVDPPLPLWPFTGRWQRCLAATERPVRERNAVWVGDLCIVPAGPNVNVYLIHTHRARAGGGDRGPLPGRARRACPGTRRSASSSRGMPGDPCATIGARCSGSPRPPGTTGCPVFDRPDRDIVVRGLQDLLGMPSGGDVILYGHYADAGCVNFLDERGSHAGPSEDELYAFLAAPPGVAFDFRAVTRARDLHPLFARYHAGQPGFGRAPGEPRAEDRRWLSGSPAPERELRPDTLRFCPLCGAAVVRRVVAQDMREYPVCSGCGFVCYLHPKIVAVTIPVRDGRVLLARRAIEPSHGLWTFPGRIRRLGGERGGGRAPRDARGGGARPRAGRPGRYLLVRRTRRS